MVAGRGACPLRRSERKLICSVAMLALLRLATVRMLTLADRLLHRAAKLRQRLNATTLTSSLERPHACATALFSL